MEILSSGQKFLRQTVSGEVFGLTKDGIIGAARSGLSRKGGSGL